MIIQNISFLNIDVLYQLRDKGFNLYTPSYIDLLNHVSIIFDIADINKYEYIFMKKMVSDITAFESEFVSTKYIHNIYKFKGYNSPESPINQYISILSGIYEDYDINYINYLLPPGCIIGNCKAILNGEDIIKILKYDLVSFFKDFSTDSYFTSSVTSSTMEKDSFSQMLGRRFVEEFYKFLENEVKFTDQLQQYIYDNMLVQPLEDYDNNQYENKNYNIYYMKNPYFLIDFVSDKPENITTVCKNYARTIIENKNKFTLGKTHMIFKINSEFSIFAELMKILPNDRLIAHENYFNIAEKSLDKDKVPYVPKDASEKYNNRFAGRLLGFQKAIQDSLTHTSGFIKMELSEGYVDISYNLELSFDDFDRYLIPYTKNYGDSKNYLQMKTCRMINDLFKISGTMYKMITTK